MRRKRIKIESKLKEENLELTSSQSKFEEDLVIKKEELEKFIKLKSDLASKDKRIKELKQTIEESRQVFSQLQTENANLTEKLK